MRTYSVENLLIGTSYRSTSYPHKMGIINYAEKRDNVWAGVDADAYSIRYRDPNGGSDNWATIVVSYGE